MLSGYPKIDFGITISRCLHSRKYWGRGLIPTVLHCSYMLLNKKMVCSLLDCEASCNALPVTMVNEKTDIEPCHQSILKSVGKCRVKICNNKFYCLEFVIVN